MILLRTAIFIIFIIHVNGQREAITPNLTLLTKVTEDNNTKFTCVAGPDVRGSAVTFITPLGGTYPKNTPVSMYRSEQGSTYPPAEYDCDFAPGSECVQKWTKRYDVHVVSVMSGQHDLAPVIDERWERFPTYFSEHGNVIQHKFKQVIVSIGISVRTGGEAHVLLCEDSAIMNKCFWVTLNKEKDNKIRLWNCTNVNATHPVRDNNCTHVGDGQRVQCNEAYWCHFNLIINSTRRNTFFTIKGLKNNGYFLKHKISTILQIRQVLLYIGNNTKGLWKIHEYNYLSLPSHFRHQLMGDHSDSICVELYVAVCPKCSVYLRLSRASAFVHGDEHYSENIMHPWHLIRLEATNLSRDDIYDFTVNFHSEFLGNGSEKNFWLIDDVRHCHTNETRVISIETQMNEKDIVSCQTLQEPIWSTSIKGGRIEQSNLTVCNNQTYTGSRCSVSCLAALGADCSRLLVCEASVSRSAPACTCAAGYHGRQCQDLCPQGYYSTGCTKPCESCEGQCSPASAACSKCRPGDTFAECPTGTDMDDQLTQSDSNSTLYALFLLLLLIPVIVAAWFFYRRRKSNFQTPSSTPLLAFVSRNEDTKSCPIRVKQLAKYMKGLHNNELEQQYKSLPRGPTKACSQGMLKNNVYKNRFNDLTAYDHSRVVLKVIGGDPYSDFINANYIDGYKQPKAYIATQGPKTNTLNDFWRMIWQENVELIVMLTSTADDKQAKYEQYWSENEKTREFIDMSVKTCKEDVYADFVIRLLEVTCKGEMRQIQHLQFTSWPNDGIPTHPHLLVPFLHEMRSIFTKTPIVVHCSEGNGRTGTIILIDICVHMAAITGRINPLKYLHRMREQRIDMVASFDQYKLVHAVLLEYLLAPDSSISCYNNFSSEINNIIKSKRITQEIAYLKDSEWYPKILINDEQVHIDASSSSEVPEVVSYACDGQYVRFATAVAVDGFRAKDQYIFIPSLQGNAVVQFWTMVIEYNIELAIIFEDLSKCQMWPTETGQMSELRHLTIKCISKSIGFSYDTYKLQLKIKNSGESRAVRVLAGAQATAQLAGSALAAARRRRPVLAAGAAAAALLVQAHVLERMRARRRCDVLGSLRALRACGLPARLDAAQLQLLYAAAAQALEEQDGYLQPICRE